MEPLLEENVNSASTQRMQSTYTSYSETTNEFYLTKKNSTVLYVKRESYISISGTYREQRQQI